MTKIDRAIELVKASWAVLREDKELFALPAISGFCALIVLASFGVPVVSIVISANEGATGEELSYPPSAIALAFVGYLVLTFVGMFFNSALIHAANERMQGGNPSLNSALKGAWQRVGRILVWALVASTVSIAIRQLQERLGIFGRLLAFLAGTAWAVVTFLVLPVIVMEDRGPVESVRRSIALIRRSWGEGLAGHIGLGIINFLVFAFLAVIVVLAALASPSLLYGVVPLAILSMVISIIVMSALSTVFQTALYRHAAELPVYGFDHHLMDNAFTKGKNWSAARPSRPSELRSQGYPTPPAAPHAGSSTNPPPSDLSGPQDWSRLPDDWDTGSGR